MVILWHVHGLLLGFVCVSQFLSLGLFYFVPCLIFFFSPDFLLLLQVLITLLTCYADVV